MSQHNYSLLSPDSVDSTQRTPNPPKKLIVCCDGTWVDRDNLPGVPTNVSRLARAISNEDDKNNQQIVYYQAGVGTNGGALNQILGGATGTGLAEHVREAYSFLASNYSSHTLSDKHDSIFLIGFSRGAYTARSIGGLLGAVGLLTKKAVPFFQKIFLDWQYAGSRPPKFFNSYFTDPEHRKRFAYLDKLAVQKGAANIDIYMNAYRSFLLSEGLTQEVTINCIGVFDTVGALGVPVHPWVQRIAPALPPAILTPGWFDTRIGDHVKHGFHALALDEKRDTFKPTLWELKDGDKSYIKQVWFAGSHSNIGGGYDETGIADITIAWMMDHLSGREGAPDRDIGPEHWIKFDEGYLNEYYEKRHKFYERQVREGEIDTPWPKWACGAVFDSFSFPFSLWASRTRSPGRYHFTDYVTGKENPNKLLQHTNESIHASVRERIHKGGRAPEPEHTVFPHNVFTSIKRAWYTLTGKLRGGESWPKYKPMAKRQPLQAWRLVDGHTDHDSINGQATIDTPPGKPALWQYVGKEKTGPPVLTEDGLNYYQRLLLNLDLQPQLTLVQPEGWVKSFATRARKGFRRPSTF